MTSDAWRNKASRVIAEHALTAYKRANLLPNGKPRKRHVQYTCPAICDQLVECLRNDDELRAKQIFIYGPEA